ncbi:MAG: hypothetical protein OXR66_02700 [Candidatus Woesearchaeota archaeon]|nr:hypothetical protein [Candidatus Woesearchaeota archaeon]
MELIALGSPDFLLGFSLAGVKTVVAEQENVMETIHAQKKAGIIMLDAELTHNLTLYEHEELDNSTQPVVISLARDDTERSNRLQQAIKNTLGVDML